MPKVPCVICGTHVQRTPYRIAHSARIYCSRACQDKGKGIYETGENNWRWQSGNVVECAQCGVSVRKRADSLRNHLRSFCSVACSAKWQSQNHTGESGPNWRGGPVEVECSWCKASVQRARSDVKAYKNLFCGRPCVDAWRSANFSGENAPGWKGGRTKAEWHRNRWADPEYRQKRKEYARKWRAENWLAVRARSHHRRVVERTAAGTYTPEQFLARCEFYGWRCYLCGVNLGRATVTVEHRIPLSRGGANWPANLAPACKSCNSRKFNLTETEYRSMYQCESSEVHA